ncbi:uncharacterized protein PFL1_00102 [Pseudozyma flocculosa PF-1]|uniref:Probable methylglutaconyl-coa hydratase, mitochondrial n=1 Tax=Pseudozyma flocculosa TaxID=84751 RepID=A0A5C3EUG7_9BASI|nr:uncharacterized protein PFL1_00102 [Pseudozyma flocculosa PF-1]EPQ31903.1 hypothetical protein PFL1_00102 [Pseudozyma flocculosa PF-1]SPO35186.1 probable methylglutaconyl-coa hydratase, mitochondrial precursor [Pseudozyma flocculosa]
MLLLPTTPSVAARCCATRSLRPSSSRLISQQLRSYSAATPSSDRLVDLSPLSTLHPSLPSALVSDGKATRNDEHISVLTLNRPAAKNAISRAMADELESCVNALRASADSRVVLIRSSVPATFCAGADLKERKGMSQQEVDAFLLQLRRVFTGISKLPMPTVACLDGLAMGGGLELALCADMRIAGPAASRLGLTETKLGIIPGAGGTSRLARLVGVARAKELVFSARLVDSLEAQRIGFVDVVAEADPVATQGQEAFERGVVMARSFAKNGPLAVRAAKLAIDRGSQMDPETALDFERQCYEPILKTEDRLEGLRAFAEKREPVYKGR